MRASVYLAGEAAQARTTAQIAMSTLLPAGYLAKVMQSLSRAGIVKSQHGLNGGFTLAVDPKRLTVLAVINAVDPIRRYSDCPSRIASHGQRLCPLHQQLDQAVAKIEKQFRETTVAQLLEAPRECVPLCRFPAMPAAS